MLIIETCKEQNDFFLEEFSIYCILLLLLLLLFVVTNKIMVGEVCSMSTNWLVVTHAVISCSILPFVQIVPSEGKKVYFLACYDMS